ncbi:uncharacterized protein LOC122577511 [Bombus pyrosoma]|uniref:uncharacterized protein LOC122577511 n=1 Tax=Bombus pyrosoma TaxID=396416 RepID=UPI001CB8A357|nr:uncharacterized protein LOC122577511 [Bombus pyrosoma]
MVVVGVYVSPNSGWAAFEEFLDGIGDCVRRHFPRQILVLGDFNAHSAEWGNPRTNARGRALSDWAAGLGLLLVNRGTTSTCVTWRGSSAVDITWASPDTFRRITGWRVAERIETLSDHLYIFMEVKGMPGPGTVTAVAAWNWEAPMIQTETSVKEETENLRRDMTAICDASMSRTTLGTGRSRAVHWWTPDIAELRARCVRARRRYLRARSWRRRNEEDVTRRYQVYRALRRSLQKAITAAKNRAWSELVEAVEADPWGRPYKTVTRKIRAKGPLATAEMEPELLQQIVETLFPPQEDSAAEQLQDTTWTGEWTDDWEVTEEELRKATRRMASPTTLVWTQLRVDIWQTRCRSTYLAA